jgi:Fic family protein
MASRESASHSCFMAEDQKLMCSREEKADKEIANQRDVVDYLYDFVRKGRTRITESVVSEIHRLTIDGIYPCAGNFRDARTEVEITGTSHKPAHASQVRSDVRDMLDWVDAGEGALQTPLRRAAYLLWKTNAIHPFNGGNGRVARALAYLLILLEVAPVFAGESLPTKLKKRKGEYVDALKAADKGDLWPLKSLILQCVQEQVTELLRTPQHPVNK